MAGSTNVVPQDTANRDAGSGFDPSGIQVVALRILNVNNAGGYNYGDLGVVLDAAIPAGTNLIGAINMPDLPITGTITAAQPIINTPVTGASVILPVGTGQASWKATLGGTFTSGSTVYVDHSSDGGVTYFASSFKVAGGLQTTTVQSVVGTGASMELSGNDAAVSHIKIRCGVLASGDSISVTLRAGVGLGSVGLLSSIPTGNNTIGNINSMRSTTAAYTLASTSTTGTTQNSGDLTVGAYTELSIDITTTAQAGTSPTIQYFYERKGSDGLYYPLWNSLVLTSATNTVSTSVGSGMAYNQSLGLTGRLRWVIGGTATPTFTHSINCYGK